MSEFIFAALAQFRDRNVEWTKKAVIEAESLSAEEALKIVEKIEVN
ncbi:hypothetical protein [Coxiella-like endosymbiont]|nr:hypothetical protein [Coxiella-like endosymbiont]